jgi:hypothetical protein
MDSRIRMQIHTKMPLIRNTDKDQRNGPLVLIQIDKRDATNLLNSRNVPDTRSTNIAQNINIKLISQQRKRHAESDQDKCDDECSIQVLQPDLI